MNQPSKSDEWAKLVGYLTIAAVCFAIAWKSFAFVFSDRVPSASEPAEWWKGGTLHRALPEAWRAGTARDKLATAADLCAARVTHVRAELKLKQDAEVVRPCATALVQCVDWRTAGARPDSPAYDHAVLCFNLLDWDYE